MEKSTTQHSKRNDHSNAGQCSRNFTDGANPTLLQMERPMMVRVGRPKQAPHEIRQSAEISKRLATENPYDNDDLSGALTELVNTCKDPGRRDEALQLGSIVLKITEGLAARNRHDFEPIQARTLNIVGSLYAVLDRPEEALRMTKRSAEIRGRLAKQNPGVFEPELAMSLSNLGVRYSEVGIPKEALKATSRAVEIFERLPLEQRIAFEPQLARSLNNLGQFYHQLSRPGEAISSLGWRGETFKRLAKQNPQAFGQKLSRTHQVEHGVRLLNTRESTKEDSVAA